MERVSDILDSGRPQALRGVERLTSKDVLERRIPCDKEIPAPETCKYCGAKLYYEAITMGGKVWMFSPEPQRCTCKGAKEYWTRRDEAAERRKQRAFEDAERERRRRKIERLLGRSGIKRRFRQRTFRSFVTDTPDRKKAYDAAKGYADQFPDRAAKGEGLYIEGSNGTGKTHLAAAISLRLIEEGIPVVCKTSTDILEDVKKGYDEGSEAEILKAYKDADLLVIDDLGKEQCTDWSMSTLYAIINDRYEDMKPTIITTNYNADDLARVMTPRGYDDGKIRAIISRLRETSTVITMAWEDCRGQ